MVVYCRKCGQYRDMVHPKKIQMKNGRVGYEGKCSRCNVKLMRESR